MNNLSFLAVATGAALQLFAAAPAPAQETAEEAYSEITEAFGFVPTFMREYPEHGIAGAWILTRDLELSEETALSPKIKSLINVAVGAQIPCRYCIYVDTLTAKSLGASDQEIKEAVAQAALTRHWSTILNGLQIDFDEFKAEFGG
jgi:AhpD family alkylhydroperoxidase